MLACEQTHADEDIDRRHHLAFLEDGGYGALDQRVEWIGLERLDTRG